MRTELLDVLVCPRTGQPLRLHALESDGDDVRHGVLEGDAGRYPIIGGIPVMRGDTAELVDLVRRGRHHEAAVHAAFGDVRPSRRRQLLGMVTGPGAGRLPSLRPHRDGPRLSALFASDAPLAASRHVYLESASRSVDAFAYFRFRFSIPRHVVTLAVVDALAPPSGLVLDLGCGAGHMTWALQRAVPGARVVGADPSFFQLWDASRLVPEASFVCADGAALPFRGGQFGFALAADVLSFVTPKVSVAREAVRVLAAGGAVAMTSVKNSAAAHVYAGEPLTIGGWRGLVGHLPNRLLPDDVIVAAYLAGDGLPARHDWPDDDLETAQTVTVVAVNAGEHEFDDGGALLGWPHARGPLAVNPLYRSTTSRPGGPVRFVRDLPSSSFAEDNALALTYLPAGFELTPDAIAAGASGATHPELEPLIARLAVLSLPAGYTERAWPEPGPTRPSPATSRRDLEGSVP